MPVEKPEKCQFGKPTKKPKKPKEEPDPVEPPVVSDEDAEMWVLEQYDGAGERIEDYVVSLGVIKQTMANLAVKRDATIIPVEPVEPDEPVEPELTEENADTYVDDVEQYLEDYSQYEKDMETYEEEVKARTKLVKLKARYAALHDSYNYIVETIKET